MHLGISDDHWHGVFTFLGMLLIPIFIIFYWSVPVDQFNVLVIYTSVSVFLIHLQLWNEYIQAMDKLVSRKYGSYKSFQKNSKRDWKFMLIGLFLGNFTGLIILSIMKYLGLFSVK